MQNRDFSLGSIMNNYAWQSLAYSTLGSAVSPPIKS